MYKTLNKTLLRGCLLACIWFSLGMQGGERVDGVAYSPREGTYGGEGFVAFDENRNPTQDAKDAEFVFSGLTNFPGTQGYVQIQVLDYGDQISDQSNGAPWRDRATVIPDNAPFDYLGDNGAPRYQWSKTLKLFEPFPQTDPLLPTGTVKPWRNQSTARVRFIAVATDSKGTPVASRFMVTFDKDGFRTGSPGDDAQMVLAHFSERNGPESLDVIPRYDFLDGFKLRGKDSSIFPNDTDHTKQKAETDAYYSAVKIGADGATGQSIKEGLKDLASFKMKYFESVSEECRRKDLPILLSGGEAHATYFNYGDLGLGRNMHCTRNGCTNETACYVENFGTIGTDKTGKPIGLPYFDDQLKVKEAFDKSLPFAVVAMVERGQMKMDDLNQTFFVVYSDYTKSDTNPTQGDTNPGLGYEAQLDFTGHNTFIPGNCLSCHGIGSSYTKSDNNEFGAKLARFLPFDLSAFRYFSDEPTNALSRAAQDSQFFALNLLIGRTSISTDNPEFLELMSGWYTPVYSPGGQLRPGLFNDDFVPQAWSDSETHKQLYRKTIAPVCRSCHISQQAENFGQFRFGLPAYFDKATILPLVCDGHSMPNAEQSTRNLWRNEGRPALLDRLGVKDMGCPKESLLVASLIDFFGSPTNVRPSEARQSAVARPSETLLGASRAYRDEKCACMTRDCNRAVEDKFVSMFIAADRSRQTEHEEAFRLQAEALQCGARLQGSS
jgi:hypothetical protein